MKTELTKLAASMLCLCLYTSTSTAADTNQHKDDKFTAYVNHIVNNSKTSPESAILWLKEMHITPQSPMVGGKNFFIQSSQSTSSITWTMPVKLGSAFTIKRIEVNGSRASISNAIFIFYNTSACHPRMSEVESKFGKFGAPYVIPGNPGAIDSSKKTSWGRYVVSLNLLPSQKDTNDPCIRSLSMIFKK